MILKRADDKRSQIAELERLAASAPRAQKSHIEADLRSFRAGDNDGIEFGHNSSAAISPFDRRN